MNIYEKMNAIVKTHTQYVDSVNEKISFHVILTNAFCEEIKKAVNAFYDELIQEEKELELLVVGELDEDMVHSFEFTVIEFFYRKYEQFLEYLKNK